MDLSKMPERQFFKLYDRLVCLTEESQDPENGKDDEASEIYQMYGLCTEKGQQFYNQLEDKILLDFLKEKAAKINHSPSQKEVFWVWRDYIKERFRKWPYALEAAGLSRSAGSGGKTTLQRKGEAEEYRELLQKIRERAEELCRIPHPQDVPELCVKLKRYTDDWNIVIRDAKLDSQFFRKKPGIKITDLEPEYQELFRKLALQAEFLGRAPLKSEIEDSERKKLIERCGSWRNVLYQINLEPVIRINPFSSTHIHEAETEKERSHKTSLYDCYYRVLFPNRQTSADLEALYHLKNILKHPPEKKEVPQELRKRLQAACGSYANALFQLEYMTTEQKEENDEKNSDGQ